MVTLSKKPVLVSAPNGLPITGSFEICPCRSIIAQFWRVDGGTRDFDYSGDSEMFYEEQRIVERDNQRVFLDEEGNEWLESQLIVTENASLGALKGGGIVL